MVVIDLVLSFNNTVDKRIWVNWSEVEYFDTSLFCFAQRNSVTFYFACTKIFKISSKKTVFHFGICSWFHYTLTRQYGDKDCEKSANVW